MAARDDAPIQIPMDDPEAEQALIGAMLSSIDARVAGSQTCLDEDFTVPEHRAAFQAIKRLMARGSGVDPVIVHAELQTLPVALDRRVDWLEYLGELQVNNRWLAKNAGAYARLVADKGKARRAEAASLEFRAALHAGVDPTTAMATLFSALNEGAAQAMVGMDRLVEHALDLLEHGRPSGGVATGLPELDDILHGGFLPGNLVIGGARPGMGKSAWSLSLARTAAARGKKVLVVSGEMSELEIAMRLVAQIAGIPASVSMNAAGPEDYSPGEIARFGDAVEQMLPLPIKVIDRSTTISAIRAFAQAEAMTGQGFDLIVIDFLQIMRPEPRSGSDRGRQNDVSEMARACKDLAMDLGTVVLALCQLNRNLESRSDKRPMLSDLRDSGEIEQAADVVVFLYRDEMYDPTTQDLGVMELIVAKQRNGQAGVTARAAFLGERALVVPLARGFGKAKIVSPAGEAGGEPPSSPGADDRELQGADQW